MFKSTKVILNFATFAVAGVFLGLGWIQEASWLQIMFVLLGVHNVARVAESYVNGKKVDNGQS